MTEVNPHINMKFEINLGTSRDRLPITLINIYILITLLLYLFGPVRFHSDYSIFMILYMLIVLSAINIGYFRAVRNSNIVNGSFLYDSEIEHRTDVPLPFWFQIVGFIITFVMFIVGFITTGFSGISGNLANTMAEAYTFTQSGGKYVQGIDVPMWIYMHFAIFVYLSIVDGIIYFKKINLPRKVIWILTLLFIVGYFVLFRGQQKTLGDIFVLIVSAILIRFALPGGYRQIKHNNKVIFLIIVVVIAFSYVLATAFGARIKYLNGIGYPAFPLNAKFYNVNLNSGLLQFMPESTRLGFADLDFYLCNGLCGLSYCLACPPTWSYGVGSISDLADILERRAGLNISQNTYMYKAYELYGYPHSEYWHTLFPSVASDWTFIGALIVVGIYAYMYGMCWEEILLGKNKESIFLFSMLNIVWIYLPANNQIFSTRTTAIIFVVCIILWCRRNNNTSRKWLFYEKKNIHFKIH